MILERKTFRQTAELLSDAVILTDSKGRIEWTNQAFHDLCGHSRKAVKNCRPGSFLQGPDTDRETVRQIRESLKKKKPVAVEILNYHRSGRPYWASLRITPVRDAKGTLEGFLAIVRDVTDSRSRQHALENEVCRIYAALVNVVRNEGANDEVSPDPDVGGFAGVERLDTAKGRPLSSN